MLRRSLPLLILLAVGCGEEAGSGPSVPAWEWDLPGGFPVPKVPDDNPMSEAKVELGRWLFYDVRLSANETQSCASCHRQELAFTDGRTTAVGSTGEVHRRNSMSLANVAWVNTLTWANPVLRTLEQQALIPMFGEDPVELGMAGKEELLIQRLESDPIYPGLFAQAFPDDPAPIDLGNVVRALAAFQRTLVSGNSPWDRYAHGRDESAISEAARRGAELFFSERLECFHCHGGFNFSDSSTHESSAIEEIAFHNTGLYNLDGEGAYPPLDPGLADVTARPEDMGRFRAPTLRNIAVTAPYMHDGSIATLEEVIDHYARGGRRIEEGPYAGDGSASPLKSNFVKGFQLTEREKADLIAFLESLTDESFLTDPRFSNPFPH